MNSVWNRLLTLTIITTFFAACGDNDSGISADSIFASQPALKEVTQAINKNPEKAELYFERGAILDRMELDSLALLDYQKAISLDSTQADYYSTIGDMLFEHKDISGSVVWLKKALELNPSDTKAHLKIAKMFVYLEEYTSAFSEINTVLKQDVYNPEGYFLKGMIYKNLDDTMKSISSFQTAVQVDPEYRAAVEQLGLMYSKLGDPLALQYFDNAFRMDTLDVFPLYARGVFYQDLKEYAKAKEEYKNVIMHDRQYEDAYYNMGYILLQEDSIEKAWRQYDLLTNINPASPKAYYNRGVCYELKNDMEKAIADYQQALVFDENYANAKDALKRLGKQ
ncbi:MAG: tetratricopeptide repeat protein [Flavipsychrobacter sp.]